MAKRKRARSRYSAAARRFVTAEIRKLMHRGFPQTRAVAASLDVARKKGYRVPAPTSNPSRMTLSEAKALLRDAKKLRAASTKDLFDAMGVVAGSIFRATRQSKKSRRGRRPRRRNSPIPTIADALEATTYFGGTGKKGKAFIHEYETKVQAIPVVGGEVELPDGSVLAVQPGSVLQRSKEGLPLWMEE